MNAWKHSGKSRGPVQVFSPRQRRLILAGDFNPR
jgi:hypothetical protein